MVWTILGVVGAIAVPFVIFYLTQRRPQPVIVANVPPPVVQPVWMQNGDEYRQLIDGLERDEYEVKEPTPEGAQGYLRSPDGWQRVSVDGRPVEMGGTLSIQVAVPAVIQWCPADQQAGGAPQGTRWAGWRR